MSFIEQFVRAVTNYPADSMALSIVDPTPIAPSTPGAINVDEVWGFQVRVANNGELTVNNLALRIVGQKDLDLGYEVQVSTSNAGPWEHSIDTPPTMQGFAPVRGIAM